MRWHPLTRARAPRTCAGAALLLGASASALLWGGLVVPFVLVGVVARFWPALRARWVEWRERLAQRWSGQQGAAGGCVRAPCCAVLCCAVVLGNEEPRVKGGAA
jgi:D-alanyl-lipoteichoic acid acyltransferase DltB (MBOAT superfamily)